MTTGRHVRIFGVHHKDRTTGIQVRILSASRKKDKRYTGQQGTLLIPGVHDKNRTRGTAQKRTTARQVRLSEVPHETTTRITQDNKKARTHP